MHAKKYVEMMRVLASLDDAISRARFSDNRRGIVPVEVLGRLITDIEDAGATLAMLLAEHQAETDPVVMQRIAAICPVVVDADFTVSA